MGDTTRIYWCDHTMNPWWGCNEVSEGCVNCYARTWTAFTQGPGYWGPPRSSERMVTGEANWRKPVRWNKRAAANDTTWRKDWQPAVRGGQRRLVFCASMADIFEYNPELDLVRERLWRLIEQTPYLDWLLLTKRPQMYRRMLPAAWLQTPRPNVWLGTSVELQRWAEPRIECLLEVPAVVRFISAEPVLGPLDLERWLGTPSTFAGKIIGGGIDWVITGGESGAHHRPFDLGWVEDIDAQCRRWGVAHFFKQVGGVHHADGGCLLLGQEVKEFPQPNLSAAA